MQPFCRQQIGRLVKEVHYASPCSASSCLYTPRVSSLTRIPTTSDHFLTHISSHPALTLCVNAEKHCGCCLVAESFPRETAWWTYHPDSRGILRFQSSRLNSWEYKNKTTHGFIDLSEVASLRHEEQTPLLLPVYVLQS